MSASWHDCPECGQACTCRGDIDDIEMEDGEESCTHFARTDCAGNENEEMGED